MPKDRYKFKSDDLWQQYQEKNIDHEKYIQLLKDIMDNELSNYAIESTRNYYEGDIWEYENGRAERIKEEQRKQAENLIDIESKRNVLINKQQEIEKDRDRKKHIEQKKQEEQDRLNKRPPLEKFRDDIPDILQTYREESKKYRNTHNIFQWILIIGPILATGATSALLAGNNFKWAAATISICVSIAASATGYYKFREKSFYLQQTADAIEQEYTDAQLKIGAYEDQEPEKIMVILAKHVQQLKNEQKKREQQLDQPPETKQLHN
jgi:hypothetical protein